MIIALNGFVINDPTNPNAVYLDEPINGLGLAPIRTSSGDYNGRDGGYVSAQFYGSRLITLTGFIFSQSAAVLEATRQAFQAAIAQPTIAMTITTNAGNQYLINCYLDEPDFPIQKTPSQATFSLSLIAPDPVIYDNSAAGVMTATVNLARGGGITWPIVWNPVIWAAGSLATTINNPGNVTVYPTITLTNQMTNPVITNQTTGQFLSFGGLTTAAGDVLIIDNKNHTVLLNGGSVLPYLTTSSSWIALPPGSNTFNLTSSNSSDTVVATLTWRTGYRGI